MARVEIKQTRHAQERGDILRTLKEDMQREMTSVRTLQRAMDAQGMPLSEGGLEFHLVYLEGSGYIRIFRVRDLPEYRTDRVSATKAEMIVAVKLTPRGLQLLDGRAPADPLVEF